MKKCNCLFMRAAVDEGIFVRSTEDDLRGVPGLWACHSGEWRKYVKCLYCEGSLPKDSFPYAKKVGTCIMQGHQSLYEKFRNGDWPAVDNVWYESEKYVLRFVDKGRLVLRRWHELDGVIAMWDTETSLGYVIEWNTENRIPYSNPIEWMKHVTKVCKVVKADEK